MTGGDSGFYVIRYSSGIYRCDVLLKVRQFFEFDPFLSCVALNAGETGI